MMDLALLCTWLLIVGFGFVAPFVWGLGYIWVDVFVPHQLSYSLLSSVPIALIMAAGALLSYLFQDRRCPPRFSLVHGLLVLLAIWITLTETWAEYPTFAWSKWDPSFKVLLFAAFIPFLFRSRVQIEAYVLVMIAAAMGHLLPWGFKALITGGGYNQSLGLLGVNASVLAESSTVAAVTVMFVPLLTWVRNHSLIIPWPLVRKWAPVGLIVIFLVATIGTFARTGLVGLAILFVVQFLRSKRKILFIVAAVVVGGVLVSVTSDRWAARMETMSNVEGESSAYSRILVWQWTLGYVAQHPLGGGFDSFRGNSFAMLKADGSYEVQRGRAFHNIYFATLGQHGYPGLVLYVGTLCLALLQMQRVARRIRNRPDLAWARDLAQASQLGLLILMVCGNFIDISFIFLIWDVVALTLCINNHVAYALRAVPGAPVLAGAPARLPASRPAVASPV